GATVNGTAGSAYDVDSLPAPIVESAGGGGCDTWDLGCRINDNTVLRGIANFGDNFGFDYWTVFDDPMGYLEERWNNAIGVWDFGWSLGEGLHELNTMYNPIYPNFWIDCVDKGPGQCWDERYEATAGLAGAGWDLLDASYEYSFVGIGQDLLFNRDNLLSDRQDALTDVKENPLVQSLWQPIGDCAGESSADAQQACGQVMGDILLSLATGGAGKGATGAGRGVGALDDIVEAGAHGADDLLTVSDDAVAAGDELTAAVDDLGGLGDEGASTLDDSVSLVEEGSKASPAEVRAAWQGYPIDEVTMAQLERYGLTPDSDLYRWVEPSHLDDGRIAGNPRSMAFVEDVYGPTRPSPLAQQLLDEGVSLEEVRSMLPGAFDSHASIPASDLGPSLNVSARTSDFYGSSDRILIRIRAEDVIDAGGRIYPDVGGAELVDPMIITAPEPLPYQVVTP
ncbi:MAG: hypothetical protein KC416_07335, partial [Myxococcales bacterium]|nr:hypothetical protein [Myxococcales bacterium]